MTTVKFFHNGERWWNLPWNVVVKFDDGYTDRDYALYFLWGAKRSARHMIRIHNRGKRTLTLTEEEL